MDDTSSSTFRIKKPSAANLQQRAGLLSLLGMQLSIGASEIVVEKKVGNSWIEAETYTNSDYPELSTTNALLYSNYVLYGGVAGTEYRAKITVFGNTDYRTFTTTSKRAT